MDTSSLENPQEEQTGYKKALLVLVLIWSVHGLGKCFWTGHHVHAVPCMIAYIGEGIICTHFNALCVWLICKLVKPDIGYTAAFKVLAYSQAPLLLSWYPVLAPLKLGWPILAYLGLKACNLTPRKTLAILIGVVVINLIVYFVSIQVGIVHPDRGSAFPG